MSQKVLVKPSRGVHPEYAPCSKEFLLDAFEQNLIAYEVEEGEQERVWAFFDSTVESQTKLADTLCAVGWEKWWEGCAAIDKTAFRGFPGFRLAVVYLHLRLLGFSPVFRRRYQDFRILYPAWRKPTLNTLSDVFCLVLDEFDWE